MRFCIYCKTRFKKSIKKDSGITFHKFSTNFKEEWLKVLNMDSKDLIPNTHLCSKHFSDDCFLRYNSRVAIKKGSVPTIFEVDPLHSVEIKPMGQGIQEVNVKLELDVPENGNYEENHQQNKGSADNEGIILKKESKIEVDAGNTEFHNLQVLETQESNSEFINIYDEMVDIIDNMQTGKVKLEVLDDVGYGVNPGASNDRNIKYNMQTDKVKLEVLDDVGYGVSPGASIDRNIKYNMQTDKVKMEVLDDVGYGVGRGASIDRNIKYNMQTDKVKMEVLDDVGYRVSPHSSNNGTNEESTYTYNTSFNAYLKNDAGEKLLSCDKCDYKCRKKGGLNTHMLKHYKRPGETDLKRLSCDKCDYRCYKGKHLRRHLLNHTMEKCKQKTKLNSHLSIHSKNIGFGKASVKLLVKLSKNLWSCGICEVNRKTKNSLMRHVMKKHSDKLFSCNQCDMKTCEETYLKRHLMNHTACNKCDYKFKNKATLHKHLFKHYKCNNEIFIKGISCSHCKKKGLKKHII